MSEQDEADVLQHVQACADCQAEFRRAALLVHVIGRGFPDARSLAVHCPDLDLASFAVHGLQSHAAQAVMTHLAECSECRLELVAVRAAIERVEDMGEESRPPQSNDAAWWGRLLRVAQRARRRVRPRPWERAGTGPGQEIRGPDGAPMVWVPPGEFTMGLTPEQLQYALDVLGYPELQVENHTPTRRIRITRGFWLHRGQVTNRQYRRFCEATGRGFPVMSTEPDDHPVVDLTWYDAQAYCDRLGLLLPTEAQWEYAARGPASPMFPWGDEWDPLKCCNHDNRGPNGRTMPVDSLPEGASWCGARHMVGNVKEFCRDWFTPDYLIIAADTDPTGPTSGTQRSVRGGAWFHTPGHPFAANRGSIEPDEHSTLDGFRCVIVPRA